MIILSCYYMVISSYHHLLISSFDHMIIWLIILLYYYYQHIASGYVSFVLCWVRSFRSHCEIYRASTTHICWRSGNMLQHCPSHCVIIAPAYTFDAGFFDVVVLFLLKSKTEILQNIFFTRSVSQTLGTNKGGMLCYYYSWLIKKNPSSPARRRRRSDLGYVCTICMYIVSLTLLCYFIMLVCDHIVILSY